MDIAIVIALLLIYPLSISALNFDVPADHVDKDWFQSGQEELHEALKMTLNTNRAKNVIFFLGDGMGLINVWAARVYAGQYKHGQSGEEYEHFFETFPHIALAKTYNVDQQIPDSAGTATAFLCGVKAKEATLGVNQHVTRSNCSNQAEHSVNSILHWSKTAGKATGIVTSARVTHATPAAAYAHSVERKWENDDEMEKERFGIPADYNRQFGCKDIARQLIEDNADINVLLGGGRRNFRSNDRMDEEYSDMYRRTDGRDLIQEWIDKKQKSGESHAFVWNKQQLDGVDTSSTDYLLGLFEPSHLQYEAYRNESTDPSLAQLTRKAIEILSRDHDGFFLLVEGGRIDHAHHAGTARLALDETYAMDQAVRVAMDMTSSEDTLVIVTADHSHAFVSSGYPSRGNDIIGLADNLEKERPLDDMPYTTLLYANGPGGPRSGDHREDPTNADTHNIAYVQQASIPMMDETHGGEDVPIYASGPMAHLLHNVHEQHYIAHVMAYASCVGQNMDHCRTSSAASSLGFSNRMWLITIAVFVFCHGH